MFIFAYYVGNGKLYSLLRNEADSLFTLMKMYLTNVNKVLKRKHDDFSRFELLTG